MRVKAELIYLGTEVIASKKVSGKFYNQVNFVDGANTCNVLCEDLNVFESVKTVPTLTPVVCDLEIRLGRYTSCTLLGLNVRSVTK